MIKISRRTLLSWLRHAALPVSGLAILGGVVVLANAIWYFVSGPPDSGTSLEYVASVQESSTSDMQTILDADLFGSAGAAKPRQEAIQSTNLRLRLHGTLVSENPTSSIALISTQSQRKPQRYQINDTVAGTARLDEIQSDRVILSRGGQREQLLYVTRDSSIKPISADEERDTSTSSRFVTDIDALEYRNKDGFLGQLAKTLESTDVSDGWTVSDELERTDASRYGLASGDKIVSINGVALAELRGNGDLLGNLYASETWKLEIKRGTRTYAIEVPSSQIKQVQQ